MTWLLFLDTTDSNTAIHLVNEQQSYYSFTNTDANTQVSIINIGIEDVVAQANINLNAISAVVVNSGPGSYTGLRVALSCAKGLCFVLDIPLIAHNKLQLLVHDFATTDTQQQILIAMKARAEEYFVAAYNGLNNVMLPPKHMHLEELNEMKNANIWNVLLSVGDEQLWPTEAIQVQLPYFINIQNWMKLAFKSFVNQEFEDIAYFEPMYLKAVYTTQSKKNKTIL